uniref:FAD synthase n=1 Tax=Blastobotrys adeninivorans TaxID=409370 RepID=A0A060T460_BLAAD
MTTESALIRACRQCHDIVERYLDSKDGDLRSRGQAQVKRSLAIVKDALGKHDMSEIAVSFNGGKDCQVMLIIFMAALYSEMDTRPTLLDGFDRLRCIYVHVNNSFEEVDKFVDDCKSQYALEVVRLPPPLKEAFDHYLGLHENIRAILVGIRRTDPYGSKLSYYEKTDHGWPEFMRVHPVLEWHYVEIWDFLLFTEVPYCPLYDQGYTSLGGTKNTCKNPTLERLDSHGNIIFRPAYELEDDDKERLSRIT